MDQQQRADIHELGTLLVTLTAIGGAYVALLFHPSDSAAITTIAGMALGHFTTSTASKKNEPI